MALNTVALNNSDFRGLAPLTATSPRGRRSHGKSRGLAPDHAHNDGETKADSVLPLIYLSGDGGTALKELSVGRRLATLLPCVTCPQRLSHCPEESTMTRPTVPPAARETTASSGVRPGRDGPLDPKWGISHLS
ncbi:hypothetical protein AAFF_G00164050 [Aldrovandia affinis]|uniref:Uncharacterized protein n=1 Tax=Aldrovandia affinis TaxID=143900 RepID=A0AAD7WWA0_9TELE|nr:hypothetical protein AAFF_G00164050 [Aldrovandia affinis]